MDDLQLMQVMIEEAKDFSKTKDDVTEDSIVGNYTKRKKTKASEGRQIYMNAINAVFGANGMKEYAKRLWPSGWPTMSFKELAEKLVRPLIIFLISLLSFLGSSAQIQVSIGAGKTDLKNNAIIVGISYLQSFDSIWSNKNNFIQGQKSFTSFYPEVDIKTGTSDAFSSINLKLKGLTMAYKNKRIATVSRKGIAEDIIAPDLSRTFHTFPFSIGVESNNRFDNINGIAELGWAPWFQTVQALDNIEFLLSVQGGYKFSQRSDSLVGGEVNESLEKERKAILRLHGELGGSIDTLFRNSPFKIGLEGNSFVWYDVVNGATYYQLIGNLKFYVSGGTTILLGVNKGSGSPLFNQAFQFQVGAKFKL
jgi:hypothetical protein